MAVSIWAAGVMIMIGLIEVAKQMKAITSALSEQGKSDA